MRQVTVKKLKRVAENMAISENNDQKNYNTIYRNLKKEWTSSSEVQKLVILNKVH